MRHTRLAIVDSGVNPVHPHVAPIAGGIGVTTDGLDPDYLDCLGHGTAVAGAIREKAPAAEIFAVKVFDRDLVTTGAVLLRAIDWCLDQQFEFINLSLGTPNACYVPAFEERIQRAERIGAKIIAALNMNEQPAFPGSLPGVIAVELDRDCPRTQMAERQRNGRTVYAASGYPREIPGVPARYNLQGISFAVANVTGLLAGRQ